MNPSPFGVRIPCAVRSRFAVVPPGNPTGSGWTNSSSSARSNSNERASQSGCGGPRLLRFPPDPIVPTLMGDRFGPVRRMMLHGFPNWNPWTPGNRGPMRTSPWTLPATIPWDRPRLMSVGAEYQRVDVRP